MSDNSFEYITTDYMVSVNPIEDTQSPTVEYIVELGQQGLPGVKGEPGEPGFSPVVTSVIDDNTIRFTLVNKDEVSTTPNFYDLLAKKDLSNTTYADDMANKLDKDGANADSPITLNKLIITKGTTTTADVYLSTTNNRNININAPIRTTNNIQLSPSGTSGTVTYKGYELATLNDIPKVPDVSNFLNKDGSNVADTISLKNVSLTGNIQTTQPSFYISNVRPSNGNITVDTFNGDIYLSPDSNHKLYYRNKEIATLRDIPTVGNGLITIKQGDVTKGTFTTNQSGNATIELDEGGGSGSYTEGTGIDITNDVISIDNTVALKTDIPDVSNFVTNTSLATTLASYVTSASLTNTLALYARKDQLEAVAFSGDYDDLLNKPAIPTVGNGTVTINQGGTQKGTFTLNQSGNTTIELDEGGTVDQTFDGTSTNAQSGVAIKNAKFLRNTATGSNSLTIDGIKTNKTNSINIGAQSTVNNNSVALGYYATASGLKSMALGLTANAFAQNSIQIGSGANSTENTLQVRSYTLLDTSTGLIPDERISSNIARTSSIGNGTITFTQGGVTKGSITLNQTSDQTIALDAGGSGGVTNPIALSETIGGNTYNLNIGIDKTTGNLQGTYSYPVSGGTNTLPLFSRSYGLVNAGLSNNYTTVNGYQTNQLSVKVDNFTIGFNRNGALTVTGSYASTTDLNDKADTDLSNTTDQAKILMGGMAMPSNRYINLTLGASGSYYTAPANGWFQFAWLGAGASCQFYNDSAGSFWATKYGETQACSIQAKKGDTIKQYYTMGSASMRWFRFYYAQGSESEAN